MRTSGRTGRTGFILAGIVALLFLAACGGGSGKSGSNNGNNQNSGGDGGSGGNDGDKPAKVSYALGVEKFGKGAVTGDGINCGDACEKTYEEGVAVTLTAAPSSGWEFRSWAGCDSVSGASCAVTMDGNKTVLPTFGRTTLSYKPGAVVISDAAMRKLDHQDATIYYFNPGDAQIDDLKSGDVMVSSAGAGLLRRVVSAESVGGKIVVQTADATLEDIIQEGTLSWSKPLVSDDPQLTANIQTGMAKSVKSAVFQPQLAVSVQPSYSLLKIDIDETLWEDKERGRKVEVIGNLNLGLTLDFAADFTLMGGIQEYKTAFITDLRDDLTLKVTEEWPRQDIILPKKIFERSFVYLIPDTPIVLVPKVVVYAGVRGSAEGQLESKVSLRAVATAGAYYRKGGGWSPIGKYDQVFDWEPLSAEAKVSATGYVRPEVYLSIMGVAGPTLEAEGYVKALVQANLSASRCSADLLGGLYAGINASFGARAEILGWKLAEYGPVKVYDREWKLWEEELTANGATLPCDKTPAAAPTGMKANGVSDKQVNVSWNESPDEGFSHYNLYRDNALVESVTTPTYIDQDVRPGDEHRYRVSEVDLTGNESDKSEEAVGRTRLSADTSAPTAPANLTATAASAKVIHLAWTAATDDTGVAGYVIYRDGEAFQSALTDSFSDAGLRRETKHCYRVSAYDEAGNESARSAEVCATTQKGELKYTIDPPGIPRGANIEIYDINDYGQMVGRSRNGDNPSIYFVTDGDSYTSVPLPPGAASGRAYGINNIGQIIGVFLYPGEDDDSHYWHVFIKNGDTYIIDPPGIPRGEVIEIYDINDYGQVVGYSKNGDNPSIYFVTDGDSYTNVPLPPGAARGEAYGINNIGQIIGVFLYPGEDDDRHYWHVFILEGW
jgi:hypothetical protein